MSLVPSMFAVLCFGSLENIFKEKGEKQLNKIKKHLGNDIKNKILSEKYLYFMFYFIQYAPIHFF